VEYHVHTLERRGHSRRIANVPDAQLDARREVTGPGARFTMHLLDQVVEHANAVAALE
jgi:hypothetical protein